MKYKQSIRQKVRLGYFAVVIMILGLSAFTLIEINYLEKKVIFGEVISEFFDTILEVRRFEKNYFLYEQRSDFEENIRYVSRAQELLEHNLPAFTAVASAGQVASLRDNMEKYKAVMELYERLNARTAKRRSDADLASRMRLEGNIRMTGKDILATSEEISKTERKSLQALLNSTQRILVLSILALIVLVVAVGQLLARVVVKPLKLMERSMQVIAEGQFENIRIDSRDREVVSLTNAFNKMLRELELRQRHLVQSEKLASLGTLLSGVAHELNNPLSNISSSSQILAEEIEDGHLEYKKELIHQINEQTDRARNIVRSLLEFSRDKDFKKQALPLRSLMEETLRFVKGQVPARVSVAVDIPEDLVVTVDKQRMQQSFLNLIKNAIEAVPGEGSIFITARKHHAIDKAGDDTGIFNYLKYRGKCTLEDDTVDIEIRDTGPGIPAEILPKVFDPFFTTKDVGKGSGLGLFIVHEIIEEHDGCIAVDSEPGKGTSFLIRLPVK
jgi:signal transduction histidine kinase